MRTVQMPSAVKVSEILKLAESINCVVRVKQFNEFVFVPKNEVKRAL